MMADAWLSDFTTTETIETVKISTDGDTFRGGSQIVIVRNEMLDTSRDQSLTALPAGWAVSGDVSFDERGALLSSLISPATLTTSDTDYVNFDVSVDVLPLSPPDSSTSAEAIACIEHDIDGETARVCLVRGASANPTQLYAIGEAFTGDQTAGAQPVPAGRVTLRLIRNGSRIYGYVGVRPSAAQPENFSVLLKVLDASVGVSGGVLRLASRSTSRATSALLSNFTVRSHATINGRPIVSKRSPTTRQLVGNVPAASIQELGSATIAVFGLFGSVSDSSAFSYTLPAPKTVGNEIVRTLRSYQDPVIRDLVNGE